ncbi:prolyl oligopeptidase family serine peptidase [Zeaxanthinibacter sp. PT1]|uniref:carboxylesterase family protein n=1 Tax=Zeaxanthinibacter TaxID=561554 RepID=UPI00234B9EE6|nr:prolyl oligopeptidase family serine peptidase [Zeaxanthinibacter sp. PT1]MDC6350796.1 prolyl oligopeptidase family serine peptidase [Zeaxanthinibacter sp. PT1]
MEAKTFLALFLCLLGAYSLQAQNELYEEAVFKNNSDSLQYRIMYPEGFSETKQYPVVLFLHGAGERGNDNTKQLAHGSSLFSTSEHRDQYPAIIIFPQCPAGQYWANVDVNRQVQPYTLDFNYEKGPTKPMELVMELMDGILAEPYTKKEQVYVMGLSMGGMGTYEILYRKPEMFAAAVAICGGGDPKTVKTYAKEVPMWIFHGAMDNVVDPIYSLQMGSQILEDGGFPNITIYSDANHNSWDPAFVEPGLLKWLFSKTTN